MNHPFSFPVLQDRNQAVSHGNAVNPANLAKAGLVDQERAASPVLGQKRRSLHPAAEGASGVGKSADS
jgi:hypothetical protein